MYSIPMRFHSHFMDEKLVVNEKLIISLPQLISNLLVTPAFMFAMLLLIGLVLFTSQVFCLVYPSRVVLI